MGNPEPQRRYVGRFAPSPTGPLHIGSLLTAVASFLHARRAGGEWLVRIEDIDPPREVPGAASSILRTLERLELHWDRSVLYQSTRFDAYTAAAASLEQRGFAFRCSCTRAGIRATALELGLDPTAYPGTCRGGHASGRPTALRMRVDGPAEPFSDGLQGDVDAGLLQRAGDFVIRRRDGLPAYHLAVVLDDAWQGVTTIVRGKDLLESTLAQRYLQSALGLPRPDYFHVPVIVGADGQKLSKQTGAVGVGGEDPGALAVETLSLLGANPPAELHGARPAELWDWARTHWRIGSLRGIDAIRPAAEAIR